MKNFIAIVIFVLLLIVLRISPYIYGAAITITEIDLTDSTVEYTITLGDGARPVNGFIVQNRADNDFRFSLHVGGTADTFITIKGDQPPLRIDRRFTGPIYVREPVNDTVTIEVITW